MEATMSGAEARPSVRAPDRDVAPELEEICVRATATAPRDRYASARDLYEAVERFLDGDRDLALRKQLAREHSREAARAAQLAMSGGAGATEERKRALREVSRAVALDPEEPEAMRTLVRLMTEAPKELPPEAQAELDGAHEHSQRVSARVTGLGYLSWLLYAPFVLWMGLRNGAWGVLCDVLFVVAAVASLSAARARHPGRGALDVTMIISTVAIVCSTGLFGPFVLLPGLAAVNTIAFVVAADRSRRKVAVALGGLCIVTPVLLELTGMLPQQTAFQGGTLVVLPQIADLPRVPALVFLVLANLAIIATSSLVVARFRDALAEIERRLHFQTWQLRQFIPRDVRASVTPPPP
jgi:serine/threonine-protein kinase